MLSLHPVAGGSLRGHSHECPLKSLGVEFQRERGIETPLPLAVFCILFWRQKSMPAELSRLKTICIEIEWLLCFAPDFSHTSSIIFKFICLRRHTFLFRKRKVWKRDRHGAGFRFPAPLEPPPNGQRGARAAAPLETQSHEDWKASGNGGCYRCWCWIRVLIEEHQRMKLPHLQKYSEKSAETLDMAPGASVSIVSKKGGAEA